MNELLEYDKAASKFYQKNRSKGAPCISWDFSGSYNDELTKELDSLKRLKTLATENRWVKHFAFAQKVLQEELVVVVTDANRKIVHATNNIKKMSGYRADEVIGESPRIFQGEETSKESKELIKKAIKASKPFEAVIINYKKDGSKYRCLIQGEPVFNDSGELTNFVAFERKVA